VGGRAARVRPCRRPRERRRSPNRFFGLDLSGSKLAKNPPPFALPIRSLSPLEKSPLELAISRRSLQGRRRFFDITGAVKATPPLISCLPIIPSPWRST
jgi:hypothetical protein